MNRDVFSAYISWKPACEIHCIFDCAITARVTDGLTLLVASILANGIKSGMKMLTSCATLLYLRTKFTDLGTVCRANMPLPQDKCLDVETLSWRLEAARHKKDQ